MKTLLTAAAIAIASTMAFATPSLAVETTVSEGRWIITSPNSDMASYEFVYADKNGMVMLPVGAEFQNKTPIGTVVMMSGGHWAVMDANSDMETFQFVYPTADMAEGDMMVMSPNGWMPVHTAPMGSTATMTDGKWVVVNPNQDNETHEFVYFTPTADMQEGDMMEMGADGWVPM